MNSYSRKQTILITPSLFKKFGVWLVPVLLFLKMLLKMVSNQRIFILWVFQWDVKWAHSSQKVVREQIVLNCDLRRFFRFQKFDGWNDWTRDWPWLRWANFRKLWTRGQEYIFQIEFKCPRFSNLSSYTDTSARLHEFDQDLIKLTPTMLNIFTQPRDHFLLCRGITIWIDETPTIIVIWSPSTYNIDLW